jgi:hypothetical protein
VRWNKLGFPPANAAREDQISGCAARPVRTNENPGATLVARIVLRADPILRLLEQTRAA